VLPPRHFHALYRVHAQHSVALVPFDASTQRLIDRYEMTGGATEFSLCRVLAPPRERVPPRAASAFVPSVPPVSRDRGYVARKAAAAAAVIAAAAAAESKPQWLLPEGYYHSALLLALLFPEPQHLPLPDALVRVGIHCTPYHHTIRLSKLCAAVLSGTQLSDPDVFDPEWRAPASVYLRSKPWFRRVEARDIQRAIAYNGGIEHDELVDDLNPIEPDAAVWFGVSPMVALEVLPMHEHDTSDTFKEETASDFAGRSEDDEERRPKPKPKPKPPRTAAGRKRQREAELEAERVAGEPAFIACVFLTRFKAKERDRARESVPAHELPPHPYIEAAAKLADAKVEAKKAADALAAAKTDPGNNLLYRRNRTRSEVQDAAETAEKLHRLPLVMATRLAAERVIDECELMGPLADELSEDERSDDDHEPVLLSERRARRPTDTDHINARLDAAQILWPLCDALLGAGFVETRYAHPLWLFADTEPPDDAVKVDAARVRVVESGDALALEEFDRAHETGRYRPELVRWDGRALSPMYFNAGGAWQRPEILATVYRPATGTILIARQPYYYEY
jgi:hypothetical protein